MRRSVGITLLLLLGGCREETGPAITPITTSGSSRAVVAEEPPPVFVSPHVRRVEGADRAAPAPPRTGGGGGGGSDMRDWEPRTARAPTEREVAAFQRELEEEMGEVDPTDDPCDQLGDVMRATVESAAPPGSPDPRYPTRAALRESCRQWPAAYRQCMSPEYFRENLEECQREIDRMARRGERLSEQARAQQQAIEAGRAPAPGTRARRGVRPDVKDEEEDPR